VTLLAAGEEALVRNDAIQAAAARIPQARYVEMAGAYHELLMETDAIRAQVWAEFDSLARSIAPPT
jgi:lysophospholipase